MKCKYCDAEMAEWGGFCPVCGKDNAAEAETELTAQLPLSGEEAENEEELLNQEPEQEEGPSPKLKKMKRNMAMAGCFALLAVLATVLFFGIRGGSDWFDWLIPKENNIYRKDSYTVEEKKAEKKRDVVVATVGDAELTNVQLQFYYWQEVYDFLNNNYYYLSYFGLDYTQPLDEQTCYFDSTMTWQQYFLQSALEYWQSNMAFVRLAKENNFQMPQEYQEMLDTMEAELTTVAEENGYASVDAMVQESFGSSCTMQDYLEYMTNLYLGQTYFAELYAAIDPSVEELTAYYDANRDALVADGITQDGTYTVDVRHILIKIDTIAAEMEQEETEQADGSDETETYTDAQWEACRQAAQAILDAYLAGEQTEEHFGELAKEHSEDNADEGGLYTGVTDGRMVATFNAWCFDKTRQVGDTGLVRTEFGYHVMYFVGSEEVWLTQTRSAYISAESDKIVADALDDYEAKINYKKIVLGEVDL